MAPKAAISVRAKATDKPIKIRFGTFKGKDYMTNGQLAALQEHAMGGCSNSKALGDGIQDLLRAVELEETLTLPGDATIAAVEEESNAVAKELGAVSRILRQRESNLEQLKRLRDQVLQPFFRMAQDPTNFQKTSLGVAVVKHTREAAWRFLLGTNGWQDAGEQVMADEYKIKINQAVDKTIEVEASDVQPYEDVLQGILSEGDVLNVEELWRAAKKAFEEFSTSNETSAAKIDELESKVKVLGEQNEFLKRERDAAQEQARSASTEVVVDLTQETRVAELGRKVKASETKVAELETDNDALELKVETLESRLVYKNDLVNTLRERLKSAKEVTEGRSEADDAAVTLANKLWHKCIDIGDRWTDCLAEIKLLKSENGELEDRIQEQKSMYANLEEELEDRKSWLHKAQKDLENVSQQKETLDFEITTLQEDKDGLEVEIDSLKGDVAEISRKHNEVEAQLNKLQAASKETEGRMTELINQHRELQLTHQRAVEAQTCMDTLRLALPTVADDPDASAASAGASNVESSHVQATMQKLLEILADYKDSNLNKSISQLVASFGSRLEAGAQETASLTSTVGEQGSSAGSRHQELLDLLKEQNDAVTGRLDTTVGEQSSSARIRHQELLDLLKEQNDAVTGRLDTNDASAQSFKDESLQKFNAIIELLKAEKSAAEKRLEEVITGLKSENDAAKKRLDDNIGKLAGLTVQIQNAYNDKSQHDENLRQAQESKEVETRAKETAQNEVNNLRLQNQTLSTDLDTEKSTTQRLTNEASDARKELEGSKKNASTLTESLDSQSKLHERITAHLQEDSNKLKELQKTFQTTSDELSKYKDERDTHVEKVETAERTKAEATRLLNDMAKKVEKLIDESTAVDAAKEHFETENARLTAEREQITTLARQFEDKINELTATKNLLAEQNTSLQQQLTSAAAAKAIIDEKDRALQDRITAHERDKAVLNLDKSQFEIERKSLEDQITKSRQRLTDRELDCQRLRHEHQVTKSRLLNKEEEVSRLATVANNLQLSIDLGLLGSHRVPQQLEEARREYTSELTRRFGLEAEVARLEGRLAVESATVKTRGEEIERLRQDVQKHRLTSEMISKGFSTVGADQQILETLRNEKDLLKDKITRLEEELTASKGDVNALNTALETARNNHRDFLQQIETANTSHAEETRKLRDEAAEQNRKQTTKQTDLERELDGLKQEVDAAKAKAEQLQTQVESHKKTKATLEEQIKSWKRVFETVIKQVQLLIFVEQISNIDFRNMSKPISKISSEKFVEAYEFPLELGLGLDTIAEMSSNWVLSLRTYKETVRYLDMTVEQLLLHLFSMMCVRPNDHTIHRMLEALSAKAMAAEIMLEKAFRLDKFMDHLFTVPATQDLSLMEARVMEVIIISATRAGHRWRHLEEIFRSWQARVSSLPGPSAIILEGYSQWFRSLIANEQMARLPDLLCSLTPPEQQVTETATGRVMLGGIMGPDIHVVVDLNAQQIALFAAYDEGVAYSLPSRLLKLPVRRLRNGDFDAADAFKMPVANMQFITDYAIEIFELACEDPALSL
ncbi:hypothetical protein KCV07_g5839, partial [Aureobasidium melanogenum]